MGPDTRRFTQHTGEHMIIAIGVAIWIGIAFPVCLAAGKAIRAGSLMDEEPAADRFPGVKQETIRCKTVIGL
jgi:hypothetical protein